MHPFGRALLQGEQLLGVQIALVVGARGTRENRLRVVLGGVAGHGRSILVPWVTSSRTRPTKRQAASAPLAQRVRPRTLDELVGQMHVLGDGSALRRAIENDRIPSLILHGPPGVGKTTIARIVAESSGAAFEELSAVSARVDDVRGSAAARPRPARRQRAADDPVHRRDPPLQQGSAGQRPPRRRGRARDVDRRHDREPVLRGQLGTAVALLGDRARATDGGGAHERRRAWSRGARHRGRGGDRSRHRRAVGGRRAQRPVDARARVRDSAGRRQRARGPPRR